MPGGGGVGVSGVGGALGGVSGAARRWSTATGQSHHSQDHGEHLGHQYILGWVEFFNPDLLIDALDQNIIQYSSQIIIHENLKN